MVSTYLNVGARAISCWVLLDVWNDPCCLIIPFVRDQKVVHSGTVPCYSCKETLKQRQQRLVVPGDTDKKWLLGLQGFIEAQALAMLIRIPWKPTANKKHRKTSASSAKTSKKNSQILRSMPKFGFYVSTPVVSITSFEIRWDAEKRPASQLRLGHRVIASGRPPFGDFWFRFLKQNSWFLFQKTASDSWMFHIFTNFFLSFFKKHCFFDFFGYRTADIPRTRQWKVCHRSCFSFVRWKFRPKRLSKLHGGPDPEKKMELPTGGDEDQMIRFNNASARGVKITSVVFHHISYAHDYPCITCITMYHPYHLLLSHCSKGMSHVDFGTKPSTSRDLQRNLHSAYCWNRQEKRYTNIWRDTPFFSGVSRCHLPTLPSPFASIFAVGGFLAAIMHLAATWQSSHSWANIRKHSAWSALFKKDR